MVKSSVGRENRQKLGISREEMERYTPILGNLRTFEFEDRQQGAPTGQGAAPASPAPDLPEEFDGSW